MVFILHLINFIYNFCNIIFYIKPNSILNFISKFMYLNCLYPRENIHTSYKFIRIYFKINISYKFLSHTLYNYTNVYLVFLTVTTGKYLYCKNLVFCLKQ